MFFAVSVMLGPPDMPFVGIFNVMLGILLLMNAYWFHVRNTMR